MRIRDQVAWTFPPFDVVSGVSPGRAGQITIAAKKVEIRRRVVKLEALQHGFDIAELYADIVARHEDFAIVDCRISVGGRNVVAVEIELLEIFEERPDLLHVR